ncbi:MAG: histidine--tRNA ligase [Alphaproteobacteria bacterium]|nr:histidine--tRNA ligase [Alphaproteobacteria bacterium]MBV9899467.1 histidine--tRNA ligase [Alphaproteobacteria bacterium]
MSKGPQRIRGTQDIWGEAADRFQAVVTAFERVRRLYGFRRVEMPVFEATEVFARSIGETTDIVSKEMYSFEDRGGDRLTLRPEFTAGLCRAYLSEGWQQLAPLKVATHGPVFRYERPQKGRYRQFHQLDAEIIGSEEPMADVELLVLAHQLLDELGITEGVTLQLNTLGDAATREAWRAALVTHFEGHRRELSDESLVRLAKNPMRILDSKDPRDRPAADSAPDIDSFLTPDARAFFDKVTAGLDAAGVPWQRNSRLVRGLDYYRHTAFEFVTDRLGAQGAVIAGGRYDGLVEALGGPPTPAVGWAAGIERLAMLTDPTNAQAPEIVVVPDQPDLEPDASRALSMLRKAGIRADMAFKGNAKRRVELARKADADAVLFIRHEGEDAYGPYGRLHLMHLRGSDEARHELSTRVLLPLHREFGGIRGR